MAWPADLSRTKNWGTETLTDADLEGQLDLIINWVMAAFNLTTGHKHDATANEGPKIDLTGAVSGILPVANGGTGVSDDTYDADKCDGAHASATPTGNYIVVADAQGFLHTPSSAPDANYEVANKKYVDDKAAGAGFWHHDGTQVYNANAPTTYTDLNLSSYVSSNRALVFLYVVNGNTGDTNFWFRTNGDTQAQANATDASSGVAAIRMNANEGGYLIVETDANGIIEWKAGAAHDCDVFLRGYIK